MEQRNKIITKIESKFHKTIDVLYETTEVREHTIVYDRTTQDMLQALGSVHVKLMLDVKKRKDGRFKKSRR